MSISLDAANALEGAIDKKIKKAATGRRRASGTVSRVDRDGTVYAVLESGIETVVEGLTASVKPGDTVNITIEGGRAEVLGNYSDPSAGVQYVRAVEGIATEAGATAHAAVNSAKAARQVADEAQKVAEATNQHFFADDNGAHITDVTQDEWAAAVDDDFSDYDPTTKPYHNQLLNSLGILLRTALNNLVSITRSAIAFYDGTGNAASNIVARFGSDGAQIGLTGESHVSIDYHSLEMVDKQNNTYFRAADLRDTDGVATLYSGSILLPKKQFTAGVPIYGVQEIVLWSGDTGRTISSSGYTVSGNTVTLTAETTENDTRWDMWYTTTSEDAKAFTLGQRISSRALGASSVSEGYSDAVGAYAHSEGYLTRSNGENGHAEGNRCYADGKDSHAQNTGTKAASASQTVIGKYNVEDTDDEYALIIGNGTADANRSNAFAVDWDGGIYVDDHDSPIGTVLDTGQVTYSGAMVANTMMQGASLSLTAGTWLLVGLFTFGTASTSGTRNISCDLFQGTVSGTTVCRQRVVSAAANESFLQAIGVVTPTATTSYSIGGSSSVATSQARYSRLTAVRIA